MCPYDVTAKVVSLDVRIIRKKLHKKYQNEWLIIL